MIRIVVWFDESYKYPFVFRDFLLSFTYPKRIHLLFVVLINVVPCSQTFFMDLRYFGDELSRYSYF